MKGITVSGKKPRRGMRMTGGKGWRLINVAARSEFVGTLLHCLYIGKKRLAIFSVWKGER